MTAIVRAMQPLTEEDVRALPERARETARELRADAHGVATLLEDLADLVVAYEGVLARLGVAS